jgi:fimbrial chaperone protein
MRREIVLIACLLLAAPARGAEPGATSFDVSPTTLDMKTGEAGLFYVTNHGERSVTIQIEALDWRQKDGADVLTPSETLLTSPPLAHISPGVRQSVRVLARPAGDRSESTYRLRVSELPDTAADTSSGVHVLLQFSVPVFVGHSASAAPDLAWDAIATPQGAAVSVSNKGRQAVKLEGLTLNGKNLGPSAFVYVLPGASQHFPAVAVSGTLHLSGHDTRSGRNLALDIATHS